MNFSDRNSRLLLVITLIGTLIYLIRNALSLVQETYSYIYIGDSYAIGMDQLFASALISILFIVFIIAIAYSYNEAQTHATHPSGILKSYILKADLYYQKLLTTIKIGFIILGLFFLLMTFSLTITSLIEPIIILTILFTVLWFITSHISWKNHLLIKLSSKVKRMRSSKKDIEILLHFVPVYIVFLVGTMLFGLESNLETNIDIEFYNDNGSVEITYTDKTIDRIPQNIVYKINDIKKNLDEGDFLTATSSVIDSDYQKILFFDSRNITTQHYTKGDVLSTTTIDTAPLLMEGMNQIEITFFINDSLGSKENKKEFTITNSVRKNGSTIEFAKEKFSFNIE